MYSPLIVILMFIQGRFCLLEDYYWREYTGTIPEDAIVAAQDINRKNIYIGQAYVQGQGLIVSEIFPGEKEVKAPINGIHTIDSYIKILCGTQENFDWVSANSTHLHLQLVNKRPIIGGHETGGTLYIGRINHEGGMKIGKVAAFKIEDARMFFHFRGRELTVSTYELLLYNDSCVDTESNTC